MTSILHAKGNVKGNFLGFIAALGKPRPDFRVTTLSLPPTPRFHAAIYVENEMISEAEATSKKEAERMACEQAVEAIQAGELPSFIAAYERYQAAESGASVEPEVWSAPVIPIYAPVLAQSIEVAIEFAKETDTVEDVRRVAGKFYRELLIDLGHWNA